LSTNRESDRVLYKFSRVHTKNIDFKSLLHVSYKTALSKKNKVFKGARKNYRYHMLNKQTKYILTIRSV